MRTDGDRRRELRVAILVPMTGGAGTIERIEPLTNISASRVQLSGDYRPLTDLSDRYHHLTDPAGPLAGFLDRPSVRYRLILDRAPETGRSWEMPVAIAHWMRAQGHRIVRDDPDLVIWSTGALRPDGKIQPDSYHVERKLAATRERLLEFRIAPASSPGALSPAPRRDPGFLFLLPHGEGMEKAEGSNWAGPVRCVAISSLAETLEAVERVISPPPEPASRAMPDMDEMQSRPLSRPASSPEPGYTRDTGHDARLADPGLHRQRVPAEPQGRARRTRFAPRQPGGIAGIAAGIFALAAIWFSWEKGTTTDVRGLDEARTVPAITGKAEPDPRPVESGTDVKIPDGGTVQTAEAVTEDVTEDAMEGATEGVTEGVTEDASNKAAPAANVPAVTPSVTPPKLPSLREALELVFADPVFQKHAMNNAEALIAPVREMAGMPLPGILSGLTTHGAASSDYVTGRLEAADPRMAKLESGEQLSASDQWVHTMHDGDGMALVMINPFPEDMLWDVILVDARGDTLVESREQMLHRGEIMTLGYRAAGRERDENLTLCLSGVALPSPILYRFSVRLRDGRIHEQTRLNAFTIKTECDV